MTKKALNGSVDMLAKAMRKVFVEAVEEGIQPVSDAVDALSKDVAGVKKDIKTTNENMQAQLAQNRKDISADVKGILKSR